MTLTRKTDTLGSSLKHSTKFFLRWSLLFSHLSFKNFKNHWRNSKQFLVQEKIRISSYRCQVYSYILTLICYCVKQFSNITENFCLETIFCAFYWCLGFSRYEYKTWASSQYFLFWKFWMRSHTTSFYQLMIYI